MNILKMELKSLYKTTIIWTVSIVVTFLIFTLGVFPVFEEKTDMIMDMMAGMPPEFLEAFGIGGESFTYYENFYGFTFFYLAIMGAIMASQISLAIFSKEKQNKAQDFLFTKPVSRTKIFAYKGVAVLILLGVSNVVYIPCAVYYFWEYGVEELAVIAACSLLFLELFCAYLGMFLSVFMKKIRSSASLATGIGFLFFAINSMINLIDVEAMKYLSPFKYYDPSILFAEGSYDVILVGFAAMIMLVSVVLSYRRYTMIDIESV